MKLSLCSAARPVAPLRPEERPRLAPVRASKLRREDSGVFRLPVLLAGGGDRRSDCVHYSGCLARFVKRHRGADGHCPPSCSSFTEVPKYVRHALAGVGPTCALGVISEEKPKEKKPQ